MKKPPRLKIGDKIGIVSPSSTIKSFPRRLQRGIDALENLGFNVVLGKNAQNTFGHNAGTPEDRAEDINGFFANHDVQAIMASTGGWNANAVLPFLDFEVISKNPKIFCGFSDITAINLAIFAKTGLVTFNGPTLLPTFGEFAGPNAETISWFSRLLGEGEDHLDLTGANVSTDEILFWDCDDIRERQYHAVSAPKFLTPGDVNGTLIGGNLITMCILGGTEYLPNFNDSILFLEEVGECTSAIERRLNYLEQIGVFGKIKGLMFGRPAHLTVDSLDRTLDDILRYFGKKHAIPVVSDLDIGHTEPMYTMPIGVRGALNSTGEKITILESAVS